MRSAVIRVAPTAQLFLETDNQHKVSKTKVHNWLRISLFVLFWVFVGVATEANSPTAKACSAPIENEVISQCDGCDDIRIAIENSSHFVAPPLVARVAAAVRTVTTSRSGSSSNTCCTEHRVGNFTSNIHIRAVNEARLLRLSPSGLRTRYIYSLRRIVI